MKNLFKDRETSLSCGLEGKKEINVKSIANKFSTFATWFFLCFIFNWSPFFRSQFTTNLARFNFGLQTWTHRALLVWQFVVIRYIASITRSQWRNGITCARRGMEKQVNGSCGSAVNESEEVSTTEWVCNFPFFHIETIEALSRVKYFIISKKYEEKKIRKPKNRLQLKAANKL